MDGANKLKFKQATEDILRMGAKKRNKEGECITPKKQSSGKAAGVSCWRV